MLLDDVMRKHFILAIVIITVAFSFSVHAQPLTAPYNFALPDTLDIDTSLVRGPVEPAGARGRVQLSEEGHLSFADGTRLRLIGTTLQYGAAFPDSATAIRMAERLRALGVNCVKFNTFDYTTYFGYSIFADGTSTLGNGLHAAQMKKLDWFTHQLRQRGIYYVFTFAGAWAPRADDKVRQRDSIARVSLFFDPGMQFIHRRIMEALLTHKNQYTGIAYKDDPALAFIVATEDATFTTYWAYSQDVVRPSASGAASMSSVYVRYIDSLYNAHLRSKGLTSDAAINAQWKTSASDPAEQVTNGGFEDPFNTRWTIYVNSNGGAQALFQFSELEKKNGTASGRMRIAKLDANRGVTGIQLYQALNNVQRLHRYRLRFWAKTSPERNSRTMRFSVYNSAYPNNNYGIDKTIMLSKDWQEFDYTFTSTSTDVATARLGLWVGADSGDVYFDDVRFNEVGFDGLQPSESIANNSVRRLPYADDQGSPARIKSAADFYFERVSNFYSTVRRFVRDTLKSQVLMAPSARFLSAFDQQAAIDYDVFLSNDTRTAAGSPLNETGGGRLYLHAQQRIKGKAFIVGWDAISYPRPYQSELALITPAYAGAQDWDGVMLGRWAVLSRAGYGRADSTWAAPYDIYDKPQVLTLLPFASNMMRSFDVAPTSKVIEVANSREAIDYIRLHGGQQYSLSLGADARIPLYRRIQVLPELASEESVLPQREISAIVNGVDPTAIDSENEQIYLDATKGHMRVVTPRSIAVAGSIGGSIVNVPGVIIEQATPNERAVITLSSLTDSAIATSERTLLTIATRGLNEGTEFDSLNLNLKKYGKGPMRMQGVDARITITAPSFDSCHVVPLGADAKPTGARINIERSPTGRFSIAVNTAQYKTPWYRLEFGRINTSVDDITGSPRIAVVPNPINDGTAYLRHPADAMSVTITNMNGVNVRTLTPSPDGNTALDLTDLPNGSYTVVVRGRSSAAVTQVVLLR